MGSCKERFCNEGSFFFRVKGAVQGKKDKNTLISAPIKSRGIVKREVSLDIPLLKEVKF